MMLNKGLMQSYIGLIIYKGSLSTSAIKIKHNLTSTLYFVHFILIRYIKKKKKDL